MVKSTIYRCDICNEELRTARGSESALGFSPQDPHSIALGYQTRARDYSVPKFEFENICSVICLEQAFKYWLGDVQRFVCDAGSGQAQLEKGDST